jgi:hypothetical protein
VNDEQLAFRVQESIDDAPATTGLEGIEPSVGPSGRLRGNGWFPPVVNGVMLGTGWA